MVGIWKSCRCRERFLGVVCQYRGQGARGCQPVDIYQLIHFKCWYWSFKTNLDFESIVTILVVDIQILRADERDGFIGSLCAENVT